MKRKANRNKKVKKLIVVCSLSAIILIVSTYTWFIGMQTVKVDSFDVEIATAKGLYVSMDGENWSYELAPKTTEAYENNTNTWAPDGLIPVSTIGDMDSTVSRLIMYEKASLTTTFGGYRLLSSRVNNYNTDAKTGKLEQGDGYVAFDLFIKNLSGDAYYEENNPLNEEAIYLADSSAVTVSTSGEANSGIENSVRVAFTQIGRVIATEEDVDVITGITCSDDDENGVTGICKTGQIWEPNDTKHEQNALNWYNESCLKRTGDDLTKTDSYAIAKEGVDPIACKTLSTTTAYPTYAISRPIGVTDYVDVYDGTEYNYYDKNTNTLAALQTAIKDKEGEALTTAKNSFKLVSYPYFTDTDKVKNGNQRPTFMTLAPNSITKVRVYIYIEGQDIDNYDFASLGKKITVNFGFTKERYEDSDIPGYNGPDVDQAVKDQMEEEMATASS